MARNCFARIVPKLAVIIAALLVIGVIHPRPVHASLITVKFAGAWTFTDPEWQTLGCEVVPHQCGFIEGMANIGVLDGSLVYLSLTFDDSSVTPDGNYANVKGALTLGTQSYDLTSPYLFGSLGGLYLLAGMSGPALHGYGMTYLPTGISGPLNSPPLSNAPSFVTFQRVGGGPKVAGVGFTLVTMTVPEPSSLLMLSGAILAFGLWHRSQPS